MLARLLYGSVAFAWGIMLAGMLFTDYRLDGFQQEVAAGFVIMTFLGWAFEKKHV